MLQLLEFCVRQRRHGAGDRRDGAISFATGASGRLLGRSADTLLGVAWRELVDPADADLIEAPWPTCVPASAAARSISASPARAACSR